MKSTAALALAAAGGALASFENSLGVQHGIKADSMISYDKIYFGFAPNYDPQVTMSHLNGETGQTAATYNVYSQLTSDNVDSGSYDGNDQYNVDDIISSGAVLIASLMPEIQWTDVTTGLASSVASYFENTFTSQGTIVWLRFAHEMNYYATDGTYPGGENYDEFKTAWANIYNAVKDNPNIYMYWSPNEASASSIEPWWPGASEVDIVGIDIYPDCSDGVPSWVDTYSDFYNYYAEPNDIPFAVGETGVGGSTADLSTREAWLTALINPSSGFSDYPLYISATWFEYGPPANSVTFYVVEGLSKSEVDETISNTRGGSS